MKRGLCVLLLTAILVLPGLGVTEGEDTMQLARTMYALGRDESYETLLMIGSVVMNRVNSPWYPDSISEVLNQPHQFAHGNIYDERSLKAAREVMMGKRVLPDNILEYSALDASAMPAGVQYTVSGNYAFFAEKN